jgi:hypothetical protein
MALMAIAALASLASSAYGSYAQGKATDKANQQNLLAQQRGEEWMKKMLGRAEGAHAEGIGAAEEGFAGAARSVEGIGASSRARVLRRETQGLGAADAGMAQRGLYNSTGAMNQRRAVRSETDITLAGIDEAVSSLHSTIFRDRARTMGSLYAAKAGMYGGYAGMGAKLATENVHQAAPVGNAIAGAGASLATLLTTWAQMGADATAGSGSSGSLLGNPPTALGYGEGGSGPFAPGSSSPGGSQWQPAG